jgi:hypothetical protein
MEAASLPQVGHGIGGTGGLVPTPPWDGVASLVALLACSSAISFWSMVPSAKVDFVARGYFPRLPEKISQRLSVAARWAQPPQGLIPTA